MVAPDVSVLTRYEVARIVGLRALQLDAGATPGVRVEDDALRRDALYVASRELAEGTLDVVVVRRDVATGASRHVHVRDMVMPTELRAVLDTKDGGTRGVCAPT